MPRSSGLTPERTPAITAHILISLHMVYTRSSSSTNAGDARGVEQAERVKSQGPTSICARCWVDKDGCTCVHASICRNDHARTYLGCEVMDRSTAGAAAAGGAGDGGGVVVC